MHLRVLPTLTAGKLGNLTQILVFPTARALDGSERHGCESQLKLAFK